MSREAQVQNLCDQISELLLRVPPDVRAEALHQLCTLFHISHEGHESHEEAKADGTR